MVERSGSRLPDFLVIGAGKSGTTSLAAYLDAHRDIFIAHGKELRYFDRYYDRGPEWYAAKFARAGDRRAGEASPTYLPNPECPTRVAGLLPGRPRIVCLRNPVEVVYSAWLNAHHQGLDPRPLAKAVEHELHGDDNGLNTRYLVSGHYAEHLARWHRTDPSAPLHVEWFEDLRDRPADLFRRICAVIGVEPSVPRNVGRVYHRSHAYRSDWVRTAMLRWRLWERLPFRTAYWISRLNRIERRRPPALDDAVQERLSEYFAPHNAALAEFLSRQLPPGWPV